MYCTRMASTLLLTLDWDLNMLASDVLTFIVLPIFLE